MGNQHPVEFLVLIGVLIGEVGDFSVRSQVHLHISYCMISLKPPDKFARKWEWLISRPKWLIDTNFNLFHQWEVSKSMYLPFISLPVSYIIFCKLFCTFGCTFLMILYRTNAYFCVKFSQHMRKGVLNSIKQIFCRPMVILRCGGLRPQFPITTL